jgi:hypothetical protein
MPRPSRSPLEKQIRALHLTLRRLDAELRGLLPAIAKATATTMSSAGASPVRRKPKLSPERRRALQIHGQYLGRIRTLKPGLKARVKKVKAQKGYRAAIALAKRLARG